MKITIKNADMWQLKDLLDHKLITILGRKFEVVQIKCNRSNGVWYTELTLTQWDCEA